MFKQIFEKFLPKVKDYVAGQGLKNALNIKDFDHTLKELQGNLNLLSAKASDVEEEIKNAEDSGRKKRKREAEVWLEGVKSMKLKVEELGREAESKGFMMRFLDGGKAAQLNADIHKLVQQRLDFGEPVLDARGSRGETLLINEMVGEAFSENLIRILENRKASRIGVYGMGGVGKTTLAKHVYNQFVQKYEGRVVWVTVSQEFTIKSLQDKIANFMGVTLEEKAEEAFRAARLRSFLSDKKISVIILDDVLRNIDMREVGCDLEGCRLIITTRSLEVCRQIGCKRLIPVVKLGKDEAWKLFYKTLGNRIEVGSQVEGIAKSMAEACDGLPLGIIILARSMKRLTNICDWRNALEELNNHAEGQDDTGDIGEVFKVLKYSFDRLKKRNDEHGSNELNRLQLCFLYCSLYPEDYEIFRDKLVGKFISEGLLDGKRSRRARVDQGHSILNELVDVGLLESCVQYHTIKCVKMHDLVRSMALRIKGIYMVRAGEPSLKELPNEEEWTKDLEKVSFMKCDIRRIGGGVSPDCPNLSTLLLWGNHWLKVIPDSFFGKMQGLCTLDLCGNTSIKILLNSISDLTSLKALLLEDCCELETVPGLGKLKALRELNLSKTAIKESPQGLEELVKLEFLSLMNADSLTMLPNGFLLKLVRLCHLSTPFHIKVPMEGIQELRLLEEFNGRVERVEDFNCLIRSEESRHTFYTITIVGGQHGRRIEYSHHKKNLGLFGCNLEEERVLGYDTEYVMIGECKGLSITFLNEFSGLRKLKISKCGGIEWIMRSDGQGSQISTLEVIDLVELIELKGLVMERGERGAAFASAASQPPAFFSLKSLTIHSCDKMRKLGLPVSELPNLEEIIIRECGDIQEIFEEEDEGRRAARSILMRLKELRLYNLPRLENVSNAAIITNSIRYISILKCPRLMNRLPLLFDGPTPPPTLKEIRVEREWWQSLDRDIHPTQVLGHYLRFC